MPVQLLHMLGELFMFPPWSPILTEQLYLLMNQLLLRYGQNIWRLTVCTLPTPTVGW